MLLIKNELEHKMKKFKFREYDKDVDKFVNAIHSWLINTNNINLRKEFEITIIQTNFMSLEDENGQTTRLGKTGYIYR